MDRNDSRSPASVYVATDSRISWGNNGYFDHAIKTFATKNFPAIIGYCGDSLASQMLISQAIAVIDSMPHYSGFKLEDLVGLVIRILVRNYSQYPVGLSAGSFTVVVCGKKVLDSAGDFECYRIHSKFKAPEKTKLPFPKKSGPIVVAGSGDEDFRARYKNHQHKDNPNKSTSRNVFHAFYQTIAAGSNPTVGTIPQITTVYRKPNSGGFHCGVVIEGQRYVAGQLVDRDMVPENLQWFNDNFEITDPHTKRRANGAQPQPPFRC